MTFEGWMPMGTVWPLALSLVTSLDVDAPLLAVDLGDLALAVVVVAAADDDIVVPADRQRAHVVLRAQVLAQGSAHQLAPDVGGRGEVGLAGLAAGGAHGRLLLHGCGACALDGPLPPAARKDAARA
eukprot:CAMPEP_0203962588 /NCGR_PEP_ID=MMETSP0359-20131031/92733_1 /ASSEMBLY_ACC=CAM_ASM_000338 /TAXON_ID=268821 /ORGANISM="Scrippsiella Hangoei, Strain SHTV-5" /LENGTH=126 /DNA_ID=CAMNT_0050897959 /DNA_START=162 /DNA_END=541 /DNA_ORIENTATION=+